MKLESIEMQEVAETLEGDTPSAHPNGLDLSVNQPCVAPSLDFYYHENFLRTEAVEPGVEAES